MSKSNNAPQLTETAIIDKNSKEHPQNEINQKELPQLMKHFTKNKECQGRSHLLPSKTLIQIMYVYIVRNIKPLENISFEITSLKSQRQI